MPLTTIQADNISKLEQAVQVQKLTIGAVVSDITESMDNAVTLLESLQDIEYENADYSDQFADCAYAIEQAQEYLSDIRAAFPSPIEVAAQYAKAGTFPSPTAVSCCQLTEAFTELKEA